MRKPHAGKSQEERAIDQGIGCLLAIAAVFGYLEVFTKGIDRLPAGRATARWAGRRRRVRCRLGAFGRGAGELRLNGSDGNFFFGCYVRTSSGSVISGEVQSR